MIGPVVPHRSAHTRWTRGELPIPDRSGLAQTVLGPVAPAALGDTLMHEHVLIDIRRPLYRLRDGDELATAAAPLTLASIGAVRAGSPSQGNDTIWDIAEQIDEVGEYRMVGGGSIVDVSSIGLGRDPRGLQRISRATGVPILAGAGWYEPGFHPEDIDELRVEDLTAKIVEDLVVGIDGTGVRSGIIGEVGIESVGGADGVLGGLSANEVKSVRAAGRAAAATGATISFHFGGRGEDKLRVCDLLEDEGVELSTQVLFGHAAELGADAALAERLLARGVCVEFDFLGTPGSPWGTLWPSTDRQAAAQIAELVERGHAARIVLGHDVCMRIQLKRYGGHGFTYIHEHFLPALEALGVAPEHTRAMLTTNAHRLLAFVPPQATTWA